jgi:hypothetical protein
MLKLFQTHRLILILKRRGNTSIYYIYVDSYRDKARQKIQINKHRLQCIYFVRHNVLYVWGDKIKSNGTHRTRYKTFATVKQTKERVKEFCWNSVYRDGNLNVNWHKFQTCESNSQQNLYISDGLTTAQIACRWLQSVEDHVESQDISMRSLWWAKRNFPLPVIISSIYLTHLSARFGILVVFCAAVPQDTAISKEKLD